MGTVQDTLQYSQIHPPWYIPQLDAGLKHSSLAFRLGQACSNTCHHQTQTTLVGKANLEHGYPLQNQYPPCSRVQNPNHQILYSITGWWRIMVKSCLESLIRKPLVWHNLAVLSDRYSPVSRWSGDTIAGPKVMSYITDRIVGKKQKVHEIIEDTYHDRFKVMPGMAIQEIWLSGSWTVPVMTLIICSEKS